jgi:hypothetical protein
MEGWYSMRCKLSWKLKATKSHRFYFQLVPSTLPIEGTEFGLLLTPTTREEVQDLEKFKKRMEKYPNGTTMPNLATQIMGLLPTPTASEAERGSERQLTVKEGKVQNISPKGVKYGMSIRQLAEQGFLPTPTTRDWKGAQANEYKEMRGEETEYKMQSLPGLAMKGILPTPSAFDWNTAQRVEKYEERKQMQAEKGVNLHYPLKQMAMDINPSGTTSQLSPQFVMEMMGFPIDWTLLPFLNGDKSQSKQEETQ